MQNRSLAGRTVVERLGTLLVVICALTLLIWVIDQGPRGVDSLMEWLIPGVGHGWNRPPELVLWADRLLVLGLALRFGLARSIWRWLKRGQVDGAASKAPPELHFKGAEEALQYACAFLRCELKEGAVVPAVIDTVGPTEMGLAATVRAAANPAPVEAIAAIGRDARGNVERTLCAVLVGPVVPLSGGMRAMVVVALLNPTWHPSRGWEVRQTLSPK
jgi:hypothetical protein